SFAGLRHTLPRPREGKPDEALGATVTAPPADQIPGLAECWAETQGEPQICVAILDSAVDRTHPSLAGARLMCVETLAACVAPGAAACEHGTHIASVIFGQPTGPVRGIVPGCRGVIVPIYGAVGANDEGTCSQLDLARALTAAVEHGAQVINLSGGQF